MTGEDREGKKRPYTGGLVTDDLIDWAGKLKALGEVWGALSWHEGAEHGGTEVLARCGEVLGNIVMDYAELIEDTVNQNIDSFLKPGEDVAFPLARCQEVYDFVKGTKFSDPTLIDAILFQLKQLDEFIETTATPAIQMRTRFDELRKELIARKKPSPAAASVAGA